MKSGMNPRFLVKAAGLMEVLLRSGQLERRGERSWVQLCICRVWSFC